MIDVNIKGVLYGIEAALPILHKQGSEHFVTIASVAGHKTVPNQSVYSGTKFAVRAISEGLARYIITVITVADNENAEGLQNFVLLNKHFSGGGSPPLGVVAYSTLKYIVRLLYILLKSSGMIQLPAMQNQR